MSLTRVPGRGKLWRLLTLGAVPPGFFAPKHPDQRRKHMQPGIGKEALVTIITFFRDR